jgi:hypothetical protein
MGDLAFVFELVRMRPKPGTSDSKPATSPAGE